MDSTGDQRRNQENEKNLTGHSMIPKYNRNPDPQISRDPISHPKCDRRKQAMDPDRPRLMTRQHPRQADKKPDGRDHAPEHDRRIDHHCAAACTAGIPRSAATGSVFESDHCLCALCTLSARASHICVV